MIKRYLAIFVSGVFLGGICLSATPGYNGYNENPSSPRYPRNVKPGVSDNSYDSQQSQQSQREPQRQLTGREEIAYMDERDEDIHHRAYRQGDWDFKSNWRYDRKAFYRGETQGEAYEDEHDPYKGGIGMDPDREILQMHRYYEEDVRRNQQNANANQRNANQRNANQRNPNQRPNGYNQYQRPNEYNQYNGNQRYSNYYDRGGYPDDPYANQNYNSDYNQPNPNNYPYDGSGQNAPGNYQDGSYYYQGNYRSSGY